MPNNARGEMAGERGAGGGFRGRDSANKLVTDATRFVTQHGFRRVIGLRPENVILFSMLLKLNSRSKV